MQLRPYQQQCFTDIYDAWNAGHRNVLAVLPTGAGKTVLFSEVLRNHRGQSIAIAHRQELVSQISLALARDGVQHRVLAPMALIKWLIWLHTQELGRDFYNPSAPCAVAGVDTLIRRADELQHWAKGVTLWVQDEAHHLLTKNKWGKAVDLFPNARGLGVTATPCRTDGYGLGRHADGVIDHMIVGPGMRDLINAGYLTDYRVLCPPSDIDLSTVATGADGDYIRGQLALKTRRSSVMGDVVEHYLRVSKGQMLGVTFSPDVETATEMAARFVGAGVKAEVVSAKTPDRTRQQILSDFRARRIMQLVNVDLFGEGFDLPAIEVVSMARATQSTSLHHQQFGRGLRLMEGKQRAIIIDHVGNVVRHGLPDRPQAWSLDRREKRSSNTDAKPIPIKTCLNPECLAPYEAVFPCCPFCGFKPTPTSRTAPEFVDGDLFELDPATLAQMRGEVQRVDKPGSDILHMMQRAGHPFPVAKGAANRHDERREAQTELRETIALWAGHRRAAGDADPVSYRRFYHSFGIDVLSAQALGRAEAVELKERIQKELSRCTY